MSSKFKILHLGMLYSQSVVKESSSLRTPTIYSFTCKSSIYCDMTPESRNSEVKSQTSVDEQRLSKR
jgi:hypothetical protein